MGREEVASQAEVENNSEILEVLRSFKYLNSCFSEDGGLQEEVNMKMGEGLKTLAALEKICNDRNVALV